MAWRPVFISGVIILTRQPGRAGVTVAAREVGISGVISARSVSIRSVSIPAVSITGPIHLRGVVRLRGVIVVRRPVRIIGIPRLQAHAARATVASPAQGHAGRERIRQFRVRGGRLGA